MSDPVSQRLRDGDPLIAIVGATDSPGKYGGVIYRDLKRKGYRVVGINPSRDTVDGDEAYGSLTDLSEEPGIVNVVVPPPRTLHVLDEVAAMDDVAVWIQPGAADDAVRDRVRDLGLDALIDACIMVETRSRT